MNKPQFNLPFTLNDRVWTLYNNEIHSHFVAKVKAELSENGLNDRIEQTLIYDLKSDDMGPNTRTVLLNDVKENELYDSKEAAAQAWIKNQYLSQNEKDSIIDILKEK